MFLGHFGVGFAGRRVAPRLPLPALVLAAQWPDVVWPFLVTRGVERVSIVPGATPVCPLVFDAYPWSHSLVMDGVWALVIGTAWWLARRDVRGSLVLGALVLSHWVLDAVSHVPDVPLAPWPAPRGGPLVGLGLWRFRLATVVVEGLLLGGGALLYARATKPRDAKGTWGLVALVAVLAALYAGSQLGPPPPNVTTLATSGIVATFATLIVTAWVDHHREPAS